MRAPLLGTVPRDEYLRQARALLDLAALDRLDFDPPCENPDHELGVFGCEPGTAAAHAWRRVPHACERRGRIVLLCDGATERLRADLPRVFRCTGCGQRSPLGDVVEYIGPLSHVSGTLTP